MAEIISLRIPHDTSGYVAARRQLDGLSGAKRDLQSALADKLISLSSAELAKPDLAQLSADIRFLEMHQHTVDRVLAQAKRVLAHHSN